MATQTLPPKSADEVVPAALPLRSAGSERPIPASSGQRRLWFLEQMEPGSPLYNIPYLVRLDGPLNEQALRRSLNHIVARHEALRTQFVPVGSDPVQVVRPTADLAMPVTDLTNLPETEREPE